MAILESGYWLVNNNSVNTTSCTANTTDTIQLKATASGLTVGQQYKCEFKFLTQTGSPYSIYTGYSAAGSTTVEYTSPTFPTPVPMGIYTTVWFVIYDINGGTVCSGNGVAGLCTTLTVAPPVQYTITISVSPTDGGIVLTNGQNLPAITVSSGTSVTWQANPAKGYKFDHFVSTSGDTTKVNPFTTSVTQSGSITAVFIAATGMDTGTILLAAAAVAALGIMLVRRKSS